MRLLLWQRAPRRPAADHGQHERQRAQAGEHSAEADCGELAREPRRRDTECWGFAEEVEEDCAGAGGGAEEDAVVSLSKSVAVRWVGLDCA